MTSEEKKNKRKGLIISLTIHALLLLAFAFLGMTYVYPPPEEGMLINFGTMETGLGEMESEPDQNNTVEEETVMEEVVSEPVEQTPVETEVQEEVVTQEMLEAIALKKAEEQKQKEEAEKRAEEERQKAEAERIRKEKEAKLNALFEQAKKGKGTGEGNTTPGGNQGSLDGTPDAPHGLGGRGNGPSFNLGGRSMVAAPRINDNSQKEGTVVVEIIVDKYGNVVKATPGARGSTTTDRHLEKLATEAAYNTKFNAKPDAPIQQKGTMTFVFVLE